MMGAFLDRFETSYNRLNLFLAGVVAASIASFAVLIPFDLALRRLGWGNLPWLYEGIEYALYMGVFLAAPWVLQQGAHVRVNVVDTALPPAVAARLEWILNGVGAVICGALAYYGVRSTITDYVDEALPDKLLAFPDWWMMAVFSIACLMLVISFLLRMRHSGEPTQADDGAGF
ncbi:MAG: TRAP transporter small permease [Rhodospirillaceae bacterium]|jgi:TRAP-type transport system small permease protein|nr:TRAP transporter small permease [Rhodospirillaceae bacterium]MBT4486529.1 TRAP transporter small permease [Rhodospirillaceae bacterium]MBT5193205.1 TRAP transporter small permease [Rhodospirillaceae bacterium]MBT5897406.1 TRAP transporter small permease [Rhodospirillaceae bacterium]MBT6428160.1 TRAP transporter small permease [Rhodospirillaceae bacterium]